MKPSMPAAAVLVLALAPQCGLGDVSIEVLAGSCRGCHRLTEPRTPDAFERTRIVSLRGLSEAQLRGALLDFRADRRLGTVMNRIAKGYTPVQLEALARQLGESAPGP